MALSSKIPPQAYTRDTLVKAIEWLATQPVSVRERANSADLIVSHYLQARRKVDPAQMDLPVANEDFKSDLRQMAAEMGAVPEFPPPGLARSPSYIVPPPTEIPGDMANVFQNPTPTPFFRPPLRPAAMSTPAVPTPAPMAASAAAPAGPTWEIDTRSLEIARELRDRLNLSCETEALRLLVTMGAERARGLFF